MTDRPAHPPGERPNMQAHPGIDANRVKAIHDADLAARHAGGGHDAAPSAPATPRYNDLNIPLLATISVIAVSLTIVSAAATGAVYNQLVIQEISTKDHLPPMGETYAAQLEADTAQLNAPVAGEGGPSVIAAAIASTVEQYQSAPKPGPAKAGPAKPGSK